MSELFGAPSGIIAADKLIADNLKSGLDAQKTMGEIAMQPTEQRLKEATAREHNASAMNKEMEAQAQMEMNALQQRFVVKDQQDQFNQRLQMARAANAEGQVATVGDLEDGRVPPPKSQADYLERFAKFAEENGASPMVLEKTLKTAAEIREKEAIGKYRGAQANEVEQKRQVELATQVGNIASAAAASPANYMAIMGSKQASALLPMKSLTGNYETDKPTLEAVAAASQKSIERQREVRQQLDSEARRARDEAETAKAKATTAKTTQDTRVAAETHAAKTKNGGYTSPEAQDAAKALADARKAKAVAKHLEDYPLARLDPKERKVGSAYTLADGRVARWEMNPATGKPGFNVLDQIPRLPRGGVANVGKAPVAEAPVAAGGGTDDDLGD